MSLEGILADLDEADELNTLLRAAIIAGPGTPAWTALATATSFATNPSMLNQLSQNLTALIATEDWAGLTLKRLMPSLTTGMISGSESSNSSDGGEERSSRQAKGKGTALRLSTKPAAKAKSKKVASKAKPKKAASKRKPKKPSKKQKPAKGTSKRGGKGSARKA